ncbi:TPA: hypothetical protein ACMDPN_000878 [Vibrio cholerae]|nr:hypothetical protein [Vibrio cholerae]EIA4707238.1 hypothetical protein [Vibrio cholerae]EKF9815877.1 hypothetical protein [Vibrio cholerae]
MERYNKFSIALEYLELASTLFLQDHKFISVLHLAGAAEEIIGKYCECVEVDSELIKYKKSAIRWQSKVDSSLNVREFVSQYNHHKNSIKHFDIKKEGDAVVELDAKSEAEYMLRRAYNNLENLDMLECCPESLIKVIDINTVWIEI